jgi:hypothetical protein
MGVVIRGMDHLIESFRTLEPRADKAFRKVLSRGGVQIKEAWKAGWIAIESEPTSIPHLVRGIGYDETGKSPYWAVNVGVAATNSQAPLAFLIAYGVPEHNAPHDAGLKAMDEEDPRFVQAVADKAIELLDE